MDVLPSIRVNEIKEVLRTASRMSRTRVNWEKMMIDGTGVSKDGEGASEM